MVKEHEGLDVCFSSATAVAGVITQACSQSFPLDDTVMINLTGADRKDNLQTQNVRWLKREGQRWIEE
jgi:threonine synthase